MDTKTLADVPKFEFIYTNPVTGRPKFLITCMYGIVFILLGNLSGNAIAFGTYIMEAAGNSNPSKGAVIGIAITALTLAIGVHSKYHLRDPTFKV
jgi:hypothetical protein